MRDRWRSACFVGAVWLGGCQCQTLATKPARAEPSAKALAASAPSAEALLEASPTLAPSAESARVVAPLEAPLHLPANLAAGQKAPLLLMLHSIGTSAEDIERRTDWTKFAEQHGIAWLAPNGPRDALGRRFWDAGPSCCNFSGPPVDHVAALRELLERTLAQYPIDPERVFVGGISNGGFMAHRFGCAAADLVRGVVSISGAGPLEPASCQGAKQLRVLEIHGDADPIVSYGGGHLFNNPSLPEHASATKTMSDWAGRLGCGAPEPIAAGHIDLEARFPGKETRVSRYQGCARGKLELWTVERGDHYLAFHDPAPELVWHFLSDAP